MKILFTLLALVLSVATFAQGFSGKATYNSKMILKEFNEKVAEDPSKMSKSFIEAVKRASEKTFILEFTKDESLYTEEQTLELPTTGGMQRNRVILNSDEAGTLYKNLKENFYILENDRFNKINLIKDTLENSGWELLTESKQIGNYTAYKATKTVKREEPLHKEEREKTSNLLEMLDKKEPEDWVYVAWYTPEIPISNGPGKFGGLPGLILELHDPKQETVYLCSEIILNPKKPIDIKVPKGKTVSKEEFEKMKKEWYEKISIQKY